MDIDSGPELVESALYMVNPVREGGSNFSSTEFVYPVSPIVDNHGDHKSLAINTCSAKIPPDCFTWWSKRHWHSVVPSPFRAWNRFWMMSALKMKESRGEEDLGLIKALSDAEYQQCEELFDEDYQEIYDHITRHWVLTETDSGIR
jgi:hypothetical protein